MKICMETSWCRVTTSYNREVKFSTSKCKVERNDPNIMYSVTDSEFTITTKEWDLRKHQNTMLDIWADPEWLFVYRNNQKVRHLTDPEYLLLAKSIKNIITDFFYPMDECLSELEKKKNVGKNRCLLGLLSTSISASRILQKRLFCSFEDSIHCWQHQDFHAPSRPQDQDGSRGKYCQVISCDTSPWDYDMTL